MAKILSSSFIFLFYVLLLVNTSEQQQQLINSTTTATCNFTTCNSERIACSSNLDCDCFSLTSISNKGICASTVFSCASVVRCNMDNVTCSIESTICVNSTRCGQPICYPLAMANKQICPPKTVTTTTLHTTTTGKEFCLANLKTIRTNYFYVLIVHSTSTTKSTTKITTTTQKTTTTGKICSTVGTDSSS
ncbi:unnamed protein product [Adineta steineri]|uniref:Uncharacterized protein n=1 Tax=Adineta steineri TaxID=433720 RepID=A0A819UML4_9BILA|nr:unnamed protein product [Adineta steineri]CAF4097034.1 unnamed protein product [Adineta steineri]